MIFIINKDAAMIKSAIAALCLVLLQCSLLSAQSQTTEPASCVVVELHGEVDFAMSSFTQRAAQIARDAGAQTVVFDIDTFGGRVDSALEISTTITDLREIHTIAYISVKAISAGALIALSCNEIIMREHTTLGDCAPIAITQEGPQMLGEKFQSPLRAEFRKLAEYNGYPVALAEAMVSQDIEVLKVTYTDGHYRYMTGKEYDEMTDEERARIYKKQTIVDNTQLLTIHDQEALELGFARQVVASDDELFEMLDVDTADMLRIEFTWSEQFVRFIERITPILMLVGMLALYTELKVPGVGLPGLIALICFGLVFGSKIFVGLASYTELALFIVGLVLIILEIFVIPGFGIAGISGIFLLALSLFMASQSFVIPTVPWQVELTKDWLVQFSFVLIAFFAGAVLMAKLLPRSSIARKIVLETQLSGKEGFVDRSVSYSQYLNARGVTITMLRPSGKAQFGDAILDVISDSGFIAKDTPVEVIQVAGKKLIVEQRENA